MLTEPDVMVLGRMRLFGALDQSTLRRLAGRIQVRVAEKGEVLFHQGDPADRFYGVISGWTKVFRATAGGEEAVLGVFGSGETFAEAAMFLDARYPATAAVVETCRLARFDREVIETEIGKDAGFGLSMLGAISHHLHAMTLQVEQLKTRNSEQRLARFLLSLCPSGAEAARVDLPYEKALIAARLGMKPESLSRALAKLGGAGLAVDGNTVHVRDIAALRARCMSDHMRGD